MRRQVKNCQRQLRTSEPAGLQKFPVLAWQLQGVEARSANTQEKEAVCDVFNESQPGSWLVAICERSENRGSGGG